MRLSAVLTDRARVIRPVAVGGRVEGRTPLVPLAGEWLPARLIMGAARESAEHGYLRVVQTGEVLLAAGVEVRASDELFVRSAVGDGRWNVVGQPEALRGRRRSLAVRVPVERIAEPTTERLA